MDKKKILELCQKENPLHDEGEEYEQNNGRKWGIAGFLILYAGIVFYNLALGISSILPTVFLLGYLTCEAFGQYAARRKKIMLFTGTLGAIGTVSALALYVTETLQS